MTMTTTLIIERDGTELEAECHFVYHKLSRGHRDSFGVPEEPDSPAYMEFIGATCDGVEIELTNDEQERAEEQALDEMADAAMDYPDRD
jgi:hypothetical protein